jgi:hypothetical protein
LVLLTTTGRRGTDDKHVTVPDAVIFGARSDIAMITVTSSDCTGDNRSKFILREDKQLLSCVESVRLIVGKGTVTELCRECKANYGEGNSY